MAYYFSKTLPVGFEEAVLRTTEALKQEGFGIITEIDQPLNAAVVCCHEGVSAHMPVFLQSLSCVPQIIAVAGELAAKCDRAIDRRARWALMSGRFADR